MKGILSKACSRRCTTSRARDFRFGLQNSLKPRFLESGFENICFSRTTGSPPNDRILPSRGGVSIHARKRNTVARDTSLRLLGISSALILAGSLAGCGTTGTSGTGVLSAPQVEIEAPAPVQTPNVMLVRKTVFPYDTSIAVETAFEQYGPCTPKSRLWEEVEPGDVQFSCRLDDGSVIQFEFRIDKKNKAALRMVTFTSMNDAEYAGISVRGPDADDMLKKVYMNEPLF